MDYAKLSDDDLDKLVSQKMQAAPTTKAPDFSKMSDAELDAAVHQKLNTPSMSQGKAALIKGEEGMFLGLRPVVAGVGSAIGEAINKITNPYEVSYARGSAPKSTGEDLKNAFSEGRKDANIEQNAAEREYPKTAFAANLAGSALTLPFAPAGKGIAGAAKLGAGLGAAQAAGSAESAPEAVEMIGKNLALGGAGYVTGKALSKATDVIAESGAGQKAADAAKKLFAKTAEAFTGVPDKEIETYALQYDKIKDLMDKSGGNIPYAAEIQKENLQSAVKATKSHLNQQISSALENAPDTKNIDVSPIVKRLEEYKTKINPALEPEAIKDVDNLLSRVKGTAPLGSPSLSAYQANTEKNVADIPEMRGEYHFGPMGADKRPLGGPTAPVINNDADKIITLPVGGGEPKYLANVKTTQQIKQFLQDQASGAFQDSPFGFQVGKKASNAAKDGYLQAKHIMDTYGPIEVKNANRQLFQLHKIEDRINNNLLTPGKSDAALMAVGGGAQNRDSLALQRLGDLTGKDFIGDAGVLASANRFNDPKFSPAYGTGKSLLPVMAGAGLGGFIGGAPGVAIGAAAGGVAASPAMLKMAIDTGRITNGMVVNLADKLKVPTQYLLNTPQGNQLLIRALLPQGNQDPIMSTTIRSGVGKK